MELRILYIQYTNPAAYPPLEHSSRILAKDGWAILFLGTGAQGANELEFSPHPNIVVRQWRFCPAGWRQKVHFAGFGLWCVWTVLFWRPKWIYASDPLACPVALMLSFVPGLRVLYHEHDSPKTESRKQKAEGGEPGRHLTPALSPRGAEREQLPDFSFQLSKFQRFLLWCRKQLARRAALCVLPNQRRLEMFVEQTGRKGQTLCVWNCPSRAEAESPLAKDAGKFIVFYHGSIVPARLPMSVIEALAKLPSNVELRVAGYETTGAAGYVADLSALASRLGIRERFIHLGSLKDRERLLSETRRAQMGLALMPTQSADVNMEAMTGASNKPFEYLACGLALLVSDLPDWREMFVEPGYGLACNPGDPDGIAQALRWFIEHPEETRQMGERGRERIAAEWNYESQFARVRELMESI